MWLNRGDCSVTFIGRGGMSLPQLRSHFDDIVSRGPNVLYIMEIGCIDISGRDPLSLAAEYLSSLGLSLPVVEWWLLGRYFSAIWPPRFPRCIQF